MINFNKTSYIKIILIYLILIVASSFFILPMLAAFVTAFKPGPIQMSSPPIWIFEPTILNFEKVRKEEEEDPWGNAGER